MAPITAMVMVSMVNAVREFFTNGNFSLGNILLHVVYIIILGALLYMTGAMTWGFLSIGRYKIWLRGTILIERRILLRRRIDLRSAKVELRPRTENQNQLLLVAIDQQSSKSIDFLIQDSHISLPASELTALAQAILADPDHRPRAGHDQAAARTVADKLRELATADRQIR
ncbi:hypothetical protein [Salinispora fenicalii]|uniref:hypothetical protein n=1 Tax=Salinispora fenicalii TaxID=1137263 RepID=UPI000486CA55|nr:hypothetical protein [Salinispora fenicalii]